MGLQRTSGLSAVGVLLVAGLVAGCGSSSSSSSGDTNTSAPASSSTPSPSAVPSTVAPPTNADLTAVLLSAAQVDKDGNGTFTASPNEFDADKASSGCAALDVFNKAAKGSQKARAGLDYDDTAKQLTAAEVLAYVPAAESLFTALKDAVNSCTSLTANGNTLQLESLDDPDISGADDSLSAQATGTISGTAVSVNIAIARFGETIVQMTYGGAVSPEDSTTAVTQLLSAAATKAQPVINL